MIDIFNQLIDSFIDTRVGIADHFLSEALAGHLKDNLNIFYAKNLLQPAGIGNDATVAHNSTVRSDRILWLDRVNNDEHEHTFFDLMDSFVSHLNNTCYTGITGYEFHYALYEKGAFYKKHLDQFRNNDSRQYSMIMYLNDGWEKSDGGELRIHHADSEQDINPVNGTSVFFKSSELVHEVLLTNKRRLSITGWLKV